MVVLAVFQPGCQSSPARQAEESEYDAVSAPTPLGGSPLDAAYTPATWPIGEEEKDAISFALGVLPVLETHCTSCHSGQTAAAGLSLAGPAEILRGGAHAGPAVVPGAPDDSPLVLYIRGILRPKMPKNRPEVPEEELHVIRVWIAAGAREQS